MNRQQYLLTCLAEECAEVAQRVSKALRFGLDEIQPGQPFTNAQRIVEELLDLQAVADMLHVEGALAMPYASEQVVAHAAKRAKVEKFMAYSRERGTLE